MERNYQLEVGDVVLAQEAGWGLGQKDIGKYVEILELCSYCDGIRGAKVRGYQCTLESFSPACGSPIAYHSFGAVPMVLLNTKEEHVAPEPNEALMELMEEEYTGSSSNYYKVYVKHPTTLPDPYEAECNDVIESLNMTFAEGNAFKAIWRKAKARQGVKKKGYDNGVYDSEKVVFFGERMLIEAKDGD